MNRRDLIKTGALAFAGVLFPKQFAKNKVNWDFKNNVYSFTYKIGDSGNSYGSTIYVLDFNDINTTVKYFVNSCLYTSKKNHFYGEGYFSIRSIDRNSDLYSPFPLKGNIIGFERMTLKEFKAVI